jgi:hypothetical protein
MRQVAQELTDCAMTGGGRIFRAKMPDYVLEKNVYLTTYQGDF